MAGYIPFSYNYDPSTTEHIKGRIGTFQADNDVPSKVLNGIMDQVNFLAESLRNLSPEVMLIHGDTDSRSVLIEYYDSGFSGSSSSNGIGEVAKVQVPIKGTSGPIQYVEFVYTYDVDGDIDYVTVTDGVSGTSIKVQYSYGTTGNMTGWTITDVTP